eukprot:gene1448-4127_t
MISNKSLKLLNQDLKTIQLTDNMTNFWIEIRDAGPIEGASKPAASFPYVLQEVNAEKEPKLESSEPQVGGVVEETPEYHDRDDLPDLKVNLNEVKARATHDILADLDNRIAKKKT